MPPLTSFTEVQQELKQYVPAAGTLGAHYRLVGMRRLMAALGNPQEAYRVIHVAGTSGKTSTSYFAAALLQAAGQKVGLTVSPHIDEVNERVQINLTPLAETIYCQEFTEFLAIVRQADLRPTYFELLIAFAYWEFARQSVDYAVVEVGLGGLLDGTNVIDRADKVCVITDIGLDHTQILGSDLASIAAQKAGIIQRHNPVFSYPQAAPAMAVIRQTCRQRTAALHEIALPLSTEASSGVPSFQARNWGLAYAAVQYVVERDELPSVAADVLRQTRLTLVPARMEARAWGGKVIIFDGAHNAQKMSMLSLAMRQRYAPTEVAALFGLVADKDDQLQAAVAEVAAMAQAIITTSFPAGQDLPRVTLPAAEVAVACQSAGCTDVRAAADVKAAVGLLLARPEPVLLVTGSFYLIQVVRLILRQERESASSASSAA
jgi:dihydrofolate synthase/folylpolyglutamate synthase